MRILFFCSSLQEGSDGVGDYTSRLCCELALLNHQVSIIALNDRFLTEDMQETIQNELANPYRVLRFSSRLRWKNKVASISRFINYANPDWLSLQYVPYGFHRKGLPFLLARRLKELGKQRKWHIMFHELWVGKPHTAAVKSGMVGALQKSIIKKMTEILKPAMMHTHLPDYHHKLKILGIETQPLPLFSNISVAGLPNDPPKDLLRIGFFSQVGGGKQLTSFLWALSQHALNSGQQLEVLFIGGDKTKMQQFAAHLGSIDGLACKVMYTGFLDPAEISTALHSCSIGITPVPRHALGKSGSVAAFIAHGIPVAAPVVHRNYEESVVGFFSTALQKAVILDPAHASIIAAKPSAENARNEIKLFAIAQRFINAMQ